MRTQTIHHCLVVTLLLCAGFAYAQLDVTANVTMEGKKGKAHDASNIVMWLTPPTGSTVTFDPQPQHPRLVQHNKSFEPHILVIPVGTQVEFPNRDPFFHNVFSLFEGKRFDLGLYEAGSTRDVLFDKPGISYIFCNIHAEMSAVVIALNTPYYGISNRRGSVTIPHVPPGHYTLHVWYETALPEVLSALAHDIDIGKETTTIGTVRIPAPGIPVEHKNMYGKDYPPPEPGDPPYAKP